MSLIIRLHGVVILNNTLIYCSCVIGTQALLLNSHISQRDWGAFYLRAVGTYSADIGIPTVCNYF